MSYYNFMESTEYGREEYGPYASEDDAELGYFRLVVSAIATYRRDAIVREVYGAGGPAQVCGRLLAQVHPEWTSDYQEALYYELSDEAVAAAFQAYRDEETK